MRLVSQDGMIDVPYERVVIKATEHPFSTIITAHFEREDYMKDIVMGCYKTMDKALKVIEMLRSAYCGLPIIMKNVDISDKVIELLKDLKKNGIIFQNLEEKPSVEYVDNTYFKFPADENVEV